MNKILSYSFFDLIRNRWALVYFLFYMAVSSGLLYFSLELSKAIISLMNIVIIVNPLIGTLFGIMYFYNSRDFLELLLAQPIPRRSVFLGIYLGLSISISLAFILGMGIPFVIYGIFLSSEIWNFAILLLIGVLLTFIFITLSAIISIYFDDRLRGFGMAIILWLFLSLIYDGIFLLLLFLLRDYPLEKFALVAGILNPIDLGRTLIILKLDISALLGYTGAVFNRFFGTSLGILITGLISFLWLIVPLFFFLQLTQKKDL